MRRRNRGRRGVVLCCVLLVLVPLVAARREGRLRCGVDAVALAVVVVLASAPQTLARLGLLARSSAAVAEPESAEDGPCPTGNP